MIHGEIDLVSIDVLQWRLDDEKNNTNKIKLDKFYKENP